MFRPDRSSDKVAGLCSDKSSDESGVDVFRPNRSSDETDGVVFRPGQKQCCD